MRLERLEIYTIHNSNRILHYSEKYSRHLSLLGGTIGLNYKGRRIESLATTVPAPC